MNFLRSLLSPVSPEAFRGVSLALKLTALVLLSNYVPVWYLRPVVLILASLALIFPFALHSRTVWGVLLFLSAARVAREWPSADNHQYLLVYWLLAIFIALGFPKPSQAMATSARWLVAFVFLLATIWKVVLSPDYLDERFYRAKLMTDDRFAEQVMLVSGLDKSELGRNRAYLSFADTLGEGDRPATLHEPRAYSVFVSFLTWGTVFLEGAVAIAFFLSWGRWTPLIRHGALLTFCATTYLMAPVYVFGWVLLVIGLAQVPPDRRVLRAAYVGVFFLLQLYIDLRWLPLLARVKSLFI